MILLSIISALLIMKQFIVHLTSRENRYVVSDTDLDGFHGIDAEHRPTDETIQPPVPVHMTAQSNRRIDSNDFQQAPQCIASFTCSIYFSDHQFFSFCIGTGNGRGFDRLHPIQPLSQSGCLLRSGLI